MGYLTFYMMLVPDLDGDGFDVGHTLPSYLTEAPAFLGCNGVEALIIQRLNLSEIIIASQFSVHRETQISKIEIRTFLSLTRVHDNLIPLLP